MAPKKPESELYVGLDIGTTKIACVVGRMSPDYGLEITGLGYAKSTGLWQGKINNVSKTVEAIKEAVGSAEQMAGCKIASAYVGVAGGPVESFNSTGLIITESGLVTQEDIRRVNESAMNVNIPQNRDIIHTIPQVYQLDDRKDYITDPLSMNGKRLWASLHIVTADMNIIRDIAGCVLQAGLDINNTVLESVASAEAVLTENERQSGVILVDIGGGTSDYAIFQNGCIWHSGVVPMGGDSLSNDLSTGFCIPLDKAEQLKIQFGCCHERHVTPDLKIEVELPSGTSTLIDQSVTCHVLNNRVKEIFSAIDTQIRETGYEKAMTAVLTGGSAHLLGITDLAVEVFNCPARVGQPDCGNAVVSVNDPKFSTAVGLVMYGATNEEPLRPISHDDSNWNIRKLLGSMIKKVFKGRG
ncbi:MAG: cell division protein FtsA, partial [Deltaproteobacteria bacterium]|nr:cell division protein FtsA [Deltaproteobacteria bacterium]